MPKPLLVDTDVVVDYLRGHPRAVAFIRSHSRRILLPTIVVAELFAGVRGDAEREALDRFIGLFTVVPISTEIARVGGLHANRYRKSHGMGLADAIIAATAEAANAELCTLNVKHYPMFPNLRAPYRKTSDG
jgi:predicted nucleic acid-binding protein